MDTTSLEQKIAIYKRSPCVLNLDRPADIEDKLSRFGRISFADEPIIIKIAFANLLKVPSSMLNLKLLYQFWGVQADEPQYVDLLENESPQKLNQSSQQIFQPTNKLTLSSLLQQKMVSFNFSLPNTEYVECSLIPNQPGFLNITGVSWEMLEIPTSQPICYDLKNQVKIKSVNFFSRFRILPNSAQIRISFESPVDPEIYFGEIRPIRFQIRNTGSTPILSLEIQPLVPFHFGFCRMEVGALAPGEVVLKELYLRCSFIENFTAKLLFRYQVHKGVFRYTRLILPMEAKNSFKVSL